MTPRSGPESTPAASCRALSASQALLRPPASPRSARWRDRPVQLRVGLEALDLPRATAAARAGLRGAPWDQRLYGDLMLISDAAGNPGGVDAAYRELVDRLRAIDEEDSPHPDIEAIYRHCRTRKHRAT